MIKYYILLCFIANCNLFTQIPELLLYPKERINIMSEFTSGFIASSIDKEKVKESLMQLKLKYIIREMNEKWIYFFIENDSILQSNSFQPLIEISKQFAFMHFYNAEDHGWGYKIFNNGSIIASIDITYIFEYVFNLILKKAEDKYPNIDVIQELLLNPNRKDEWKKIEDEIKKSNSYKHEIRVLVNKMIKNKNTDLFTLLNVNKKTIIQLNSYLTIDTFLTATDESILVNDFKSILEINDFNWLSYKYLTNKS